MNVWGAVNARGLILTRNTRWPEWVLRLLQHLRDEAHRFANNYNELLVRKRVRESKLDAYPSMSPRRKELLLARFHTVQGIRSRSPEELAELPGISLRWAEAFCKWLKGN